MLSGVYAIPAIALDAGRLHQCGAGRRLSGADTGAIYVIERTIEAVAHRSPTAPPSATGTVQPSELPFTTAMNWAWSAIPNS